MNKESFVPAERIEHRIYVIRGQRVMLDADLAILYGESTKRLNQQLIRNIDRFPENFAFQLTDGEWKSLRSQFATLSLRCQIGTLNEEPENLRFQIGTSKENEKSLRLQIATSNEKRGGRRYLPYVFTEHGALMLASVLRSERAIKMSIEVINAFIRMRKMLASHEIMAKDVNELKSFVLKHSHKTDQEFRRVWRAIEKLSEPPKELPKEERRIGFCLD